MYLIDPNKVELGDIFLTRSNDRESQIIRHSSKSDYSHALLYVGYFSCIESCGLGVHSQNLLRIPFENESDLLVLRFKNIYYKRYIPEAIISARRKIGTEYSSAEARLAMLEKTINAKEKNRQFCTRFVAQAFQEAGLQIVSNPDYCSPQDIMESEYLIPINGVLREASKIEVENANDQNNSLEKQTNITNHILESARNLTNHDIQTFEQLSKFVLENPNSEPNILDLIKNSGFFEMWKWDIEENPWRYEYDLFIQHFTNADERKEQGYTLAIMEEEIREKYILTLKTLESWYNYSRQEYFGIQVELYEKLIELSYKRQIVGIRAFKT